MFLDAGSGIFAAMLTSWVFGTPLSWMLIAVGVIFAFLPDIDYLVHLGRGGTSRNAYRHRDLFHYPLLFIPTGVIVFSFVGKEWALLFGVASFLHFLHDSIGIGWGVQWLYPFSKDHYTFFYRYQPRHKERLPRQFALVLIWKHEEIDMLADKYGDENWIRNIYLRWHPYAIAELLFFLVALAALYLFVDR